VEVWLFQFKGKWTDLGNT